MIPSTFATTDFPLAVMLATLGVKMVNHEGGVAGPGDCPEWREIDSRDLDKSGMSFNEAVAAGAGNISYGFAPHDFRKELIKTFRETLAGSSPHERSLPDVMELKCECGKCATVEVYQLAAMIAALLQRNRKFLYDRRKKVGAKLKIPKGEGYVLIDPRADQETRERFGVEDL